MTTFSIQTFGCRVNQSESFVWAEELQKHGLRLETDVRRSDLVLINTCTVTSGADRDVRHFIRRIGRDNPRARLIVAGCYVETPRRELEDSNRIWRILPNAAKDRMVSEIVAALDEGGETEIRALRSRAPVKIQDGCELGCTFCVVPRVRGPMSSRPEGDILDQVEEYVGRGFKEIVLTGIHITLYGADLGPKRNLLGLLRRLENIEDLNRLRLSSLDPRFMDPALLEHITGSPKICPHFHLSLQHGAESVLERMGRKVATPKYSRVLEELKRRSPQASLGADIIAGFPGETESEFERLLAFLQDSPLNYLHVFSYSPRPGTPAAALPQVGGGKIRERSGRLRSFSRERDLAFRRGLVGTEHRAVVVRRGKSRIHALTPNYVKVSLRTCSGSERDVVPLKITGVEGAVTRGEETGG